MRSFDVVEEEVYVIKVVYEYKNVCMEGLSVFYCYESPLVLCTKYVWIFGEFGNYLDL